MTTNDTESRPQEEAALWKRHFKARDAASRDAIILRYVPLVHFVLGRLGFSPALGPEYEDLAGQVSVPSRNDHALIVSVMGKPQIYVNACVVDVAKQIVDVVASRWCERGALWAIKVVDGQLDGCRGEAQIIGHILE